MVVAVLEKATWHWHYLYSTHILHPALYLKQSWPWTHRPASNTWGNGLGWSLTDMTYLTYPVFFCGKPALSFIYLPLETNQSNLAQVAKLENCISDMMTDMHLQRPGHGALNNHEQHPDSQQNNWTNSMIHWNSCGLLERGARAFTCYCCQSTWAAKHWEAQTGPSHRPRQDPNVAVALHVEIHLH